MKRLSDQLATLSVQARQVEDRVAAVQSQAQERLDAYRVQVREEAQQALDQVRRSFTEAQEQARSNLASIQAKVSSDVERLREKAAQAKQGFDARRAAFEADAAGWTPDRLIARLLAELPVP